MEMNNKKINININQKLINILENNKDKVFIKEDENCNSFHEVFSQAISLGHFFQELGYERGDILFFNYPNSYFHLLIYLSCLLYGFIAFPSSMPQSKLSKNIFYPLNKIFKIQVLPDDFRNLKFSKKEFKIEEIKRIINLININSIYSIHLTSGTTGTPKTIIHSVRNIIGNAISFNNSLSKQGEYNFGHFLPMYYMAGFLNSFILPLINESQITIFSQFNNLSAIKFWEKISFEKINAVWLTPTMIEMITLLDRGKKGEEYCKKNDIKIFSATAPLFNKTRNNFRDKYGKDVINTYGLSETLFISSCVSEGSKNGSVGKPIDNVEVKVNHNFKSSKELGLEGELLVETEFLSLDISKIRNKEIKVKNNKKFFTGDVARIDAFGNIFILDRLKDIIIRGGINYSPKYLEEIINSYKDINSSAVVGQKDDFYGEIIVAFVVIKQNVKTSKIQEGLQQFVNKNLGHNLDKVIIKDNLPKTHIGKIDKKQLREFLNQSN